MKKIFLILGLTVSVISAKKPLNIVFFLVDDLGIRDTTPYYPESFYETPNIQKLAASGVVFTNGYAACPVCSPTRSSILTGQWPARTRNTDYFNAPNEFYDKIPANYDPLKDGKFSRHSKYPIHPAPYLGKLAKSHLTLPEALKKQGYTTFFAGKWHLGKKGSWPEDHGFDINKGGNHRGAPQSGKKYFSPYRNPCLEDGPDGEYLTDRLAEETSKFILGHKDKPFLAYLSFYSVHTPLMGPPALENKYKTRKAEKSLKDEFFNEHPRENRKNQSDFVYASMVETMDAAVGKVLATIEEAGLADSTLVIFTSDNGGLSTSEGSPTSNLPYRGGKGWLYEGGIREPVIVRFPNGKKGTSTWPVTSTDFYPTILAAAGLPLEKKQHLDGVSFFPALKDPAATNAERVLYWHYPHWGNQGGIPGSVVRIGDWKLIEYYWKKPIELFNLATDPGEQTNLAAENPDKVKELQVHLQRIHKDTNALMPTVNPNPPKTFDKW